MKESSLQDLLQREESVSFELEDVKHFEHTCRASSTDNFPFGASVAVTSTCSSGASIGMSSPASDILGRGQDSQNQSKPHGILRYSLDVVLQVDYKSSAIVDVRRKLSSRLTPNYTLIFKLRLREFKRFVAELMDDRSA